MTNRIWRVAGVLAIALAGMAAHAAPVPTVVWETGEFEMTKVGSDGNAYSFSSFGGLSVNGDGNLVVDTANAQGAIIELPDTSKTAVSVLIKYSNLAAESGGNATLANCAINSGNTTYYLGARTITSGMLPLTAYYAGNAYPFDNATYGHGNVPSMDTGSGYFLFAHGSSNGTYAYSGETIGALDGGYNTQLKWNGYHITKVSIGGAFENARAYCWKGNGTIIERVAIFLGSVKTPSDLAGFEWPSDTKAEVGMWLDAGRDVKIWSDITHANFHQSTFANVTADGIIEDDTDLSGGQWYQYVEGQPEYISPGNVIWYKESGRTASSNASFYPLGLGGLCVSARPTAEGDDYYSITGSSGTRTTTLGKDGYSTDFVFKKPFKINRTGNVNIKGTVKVAVSDGMVFYCNSDQTSYSTVLSSGATLIASGAGNMAVTTLNAFGGTLDFSALDSTCSAAGDAFIQGTLAVSADTKIELPDEATFPYFVASGISGSISAKGAVTIGGKEAKGNFTANADGSISYDAPLEVTGGFATTTAQFAFDNVMLEEIGPVYRLSGIFSGSWSGAAKNRELNAANRSVTADGAVRYQMQLKDGGTIKGLIVELTQVGADVYLRVVSANYFAGELGHDLAVRSTTGYIASSETDGGYAIYNLKLKPYEYTVDIGGEQAWDAIGWDDDKVWAGDETANARITADDGTRLNFGDAVTAMAVYLAGEGGVTIGGTKPTALVDYAMVDGVVTNGFAQTSSVLFSRDRGIVFTGGVGTEELPAEFTPAGGSATIDNCSAYLKFANNSTQTTLSINDTVAMVSGDHGISVGQADVIIGGDSVVTANKVVLSDGDSGRNATLTLQDNAVLTVTGATIVDSNQSSIMFGHWNGPSTYTQNGNAKFLAEDAQVLVGRTRNNQTININGGVFSARGIKLSSNATGINSLNLNGGELKLGENGITSYSSTAMSVAVGGDAQITATSASVPITQEVTVTAGNTLTVNANAGRVEFSTLNIEADAKVSVTGGKMAIEGGTIDEEATIEVSGGAIIGLGAMRSGKVKLLDDNCQLELTPGAGEVDTIVLTLDEDSADPGEVLVVGDNAVSVGKTTRSGTLLTVKFETIVSGESCWLDWEFTGNGTSIGRSKNSFSGTVNIYNNSKLYMGGTPYCGINMTADSVPEWTAAIRCVAPENADGRNVVMVAFGQTSSWLGLVSGADANGDYTKIHLVSSNGEEEVTPLVSITVDDAATAQHIYTLVKTEGNVTLYLDGTEQGTFECADIGGTGLQIGSVYYGIGTRTISGVPIAGASGDTALLDFLRIFDSTLGEAQLTALAHAADPKAWTRTLTADGAWGDERAWNYDGASATWMNSEYNVATIEMADDFALTVDTTTVAQGANFNIASGKTLTLDCESVLTLVGDEPVLASGKLAFKGAGRLEAYCGVNAEGVTLDYTNLDTASGSAGGAFIQGTLSVDANTAFQFSEGTVFPYYVSSSMSGNIDYESKDAVIVGGWGKNHCMANSDGAIAYVPTLEESGGFLTTSAQLAFAGSELTLDMLGTSYYLRARIAGGSINNDGGEALAVPVEEDETSKVYQFQVMDDGYIKSLNVKFTLGDNGIYAQITGAYYKSGLNNLGTIADSPGNIATSATATGYGIYDLKLVVPRPSISVNLTNGSSIDSERSDMWTGAGGMTTSYSNWNNLTANNNNSITTAEGTTVTLTGTRGSYSCQLLSSSYDIRHSYMDENGANRTPTVTVANIPYPYYQIVTIVATDSGNLQFGYVTANGKNYTSDYATTSTTYADSFRTISGNGAWGHTGGSDVALPLAEGINYLVSPIESGSIATVAGHRMSDSIRGCIAAVQIVRPFMFNATGGTLDIAASINWADGKMPRTADEDIVIDVTADTIVRLEDDFVCRSLTLAGSGRVMLTGKGFIDAESITVWGGVTLVTLPDNLAAGVILSDYDAVLEIPEACTWDVPVDGIGTIQVMGTTVFAGTAGFSGELLLDARATIVLSNGSPVTTVGDGEWPASGVTKLGGITGTGDILFAGDPAWSGKAYWDVEQVDGTYAGTIAVDAYNTIKIGAVDFDTAPESGSVLIKLTAENDDAVRNSDNSYALSTSGFIDITGAGADADVKLNRRSDGLYLIVAYLQVGEDVTFYGRVTDLPIDENGKLTVESGVLTAVVPIMLEKLQIKSADNIAGLLTVTGEIIINSEESEATLPINFLGENAKVQLKNAGTLNVGTWRGTNQLILPEEGGKLQIQLASWDEIYINLNATGVDSTEVELTPLSGETMYGGKTVTCEDGRVHIERSFVCMVTNPVTSEKKAVDYKFTGGDTGTATDWETVANWFRQSGAYDSWSILNGSMVPAVTGSDMWGPILVDGKIATLGSTATTMEGYNLKLAALNGAAVEVGALVKIQGENWIMADGESTVTFNTWKDAASSAKLEGTLKYYLADNSKVTFNMPFANSGSTEFTAEYYLAGAGSVYYQQGISSGIHQIKQATIEMGDDSWTWKAIKRKALVKYSAKAAELTFDWSELKVSADEEGVEPEYKSGVLYGTEEWGTYTVKPGADGLYLEYIGRSETDPASDGFLISGGGSQNWFSGESEPGESDTVTIRLEGDMKLNLGSSDITIDRLLILSEGPNTLEFEGSAKLTANVIAISKEPTVRLTVADKLAGTLNGEGVISYVRVLPSGAINFTDSDWAGVLWLQNCSCNGTDVSGLASENSVLRLTGVSAYFAAAKTCKGALELQDDGDTPALKLTNGWSTYDPTVFGKLLGTGTLTANNTTVSQRYVFKDASEFKGSIDMSGKKFRIILGDGETLDPSVGTITIVEGATATVASGKIWTVSGGLVNYGTLYLYGTLTGDLTNYGTLYTKSSGATASRTLNAGANENNQWKGTAKKTWECDDLGYLPPENSDVTITTAGENAQRLAIVLSETNVIHDLTIDGTQPLKIMKSLGGADVEIVGGTVSNNVPLTIEYGALDLSKSHVILGKNGSITFDISKWLKSATTNSVLKLTGECDNYEEGRITFVPNPDTVQHPLIRFKEFKYDTKSKTYLITTEYNRTAKDVYIEVVDGASEEVEMYDEVYYFDGDAKVYSKLMSGDTLIITNTTAITDSTLVITQAMDVARYVIPKGVTLDFTSVGSGTIPFWGEGTVMMTNARPSVTTTAVANALTDPSKWTGTLMIENHNFINAGFDNLGNEKSELVLTGCWVTPSSGWTATVPITLSNKFSGTNWGWGLDFHGISGSDGQTATINKLKGDGKLMNSSGSINNYLSYLKIVDASEFTGGIENVLNADGKGVAITIGDETRSDGGTVSFKVAAGARLPVHKSITTTKGIQIDGTIAAYGAGVTVAGENAVFAGTVEIAEQGAYPVFEADATGTVAVTLAEGVTAKDGMTLLRVTGSTDSLTVNCTASGFKVTKTTGDGYTEYKLKRTGFYIRIR